MTSIELSVCFLIVYHSCYLFGIYIPSYSEVTRSAHLAPNYKADTTILCLLTGLAIILSWHAIASISHNSRIWSAVVKIQGPPQKYIEPNLWCISKWPIWSLDDDIQYQPAYQCDDFISWQPLGFTLLFEWVVASLLGTWLFEWVGTSLLHTWLLEWVGTSLLHTWLLEWVGASLLQSDIGQKAAIRKGYYTSYCETVSILV